MDNVKLNFINASQDSSNSNVVIFQKNIAADTNEETVAWMVIQSSPTSDNYPFIVPMSMEIGASDLYGNYTPQRSAQNGELFHVYLSTSGDMLSFAGTASKSNQVQCRNDLSSGSINVTIYKNEKPLATNTNIPPEETATFQFNPSIWIGVAKQVIQGEVMSPTLVSTINTEISLLGIASADIIMTGGGTGSTAQPYKFSLANVVMG